MKKSNISFRQLKTLNKIYIFGMGGHAKSIIDTILQINPHINIISIDKNKKIIPQNDTSPCIVAIGDNKERKRIFDQLNKKNAISIISPLAYVGQKATIETGTFVGNFCHIGPEAYIGYNTIINTGAIIEHDTIIGNHSHIAPGTTISGETTIGDNVFIGTGAHIINKINICSHVTIGAGATVIKNIDEPGTYIGTPAKKYGNYGKT